MSMSAPYLNTTASGLVPSAHLPAANEIAYPAEFVFRTDQRRLVFAALVCMLVVQSIFGLMALAMMSIPLGIVFCVLLLPAPYLIKFARGVLTRVVLDSERLYVIHRDWLLRGGTRQSIEAFALDRCVLTKDSGHMVIHQRDPKKYFRIPKGIHHVEQLEQALEQRVPVATIEAIHSEIIASNIDRGFDFRYGSGLKALLTSLGFAAVSAVFRGITTGDWSPLNLLRPSGESAIMVLGAAAAFLGYFLGPRYTANRQELSQTWLGRTKTFPYDDIDTCYYHERLGLNLLTVKSGERSITILPKFLTDFDTLARTLRQYCPNAWPRYEHPYIVNIKPFSNVISIALYLLFGGLAAGIGVLLAYTFDRNLISTAMICVAIAWWIVATVIRRHMSSRLLRLVFGEDFIHWISAKAGRRYPIKSLLGVTVKENSGMYEFSFEFQEPYKAIKLSSSSIDEPGLEIIEILRQLYPHTEIAGSGLAHTTVSTEKRSA
ncbi:MAG: hypothetical protein IT366_17980 [Candidatus Hydrogenedentes bacterium]|nr:hypothetical protein [Candidatus Hydrogenedentota bacterium]